MQYRLSGEFAANGRRAPLAPFRLGVPAVDQHSVNIKEYFNWKFLLEPPRIDRHVSIAQERIICPIPPILNGRTCSGR